MVHFKPAPGSAAILARAAVPLQHVFPHLHVPSFRGLVAGSLHERVVQQPGVEDGRLHVERSHRIEGHQAFDRRGDVRHAGPHRRRKPVRRPDPVVEPRRSPAQATTAPAAHDAPVGHALHDAVRPVLDHVAGHHLYGAVGQADGDDHAGIAVAGVDPQRHCRNLAFS